MVYCIFKVKGCYAVVRNKTQTPSTKATMLLPITLDYFNHSVLRITSKAYAVRLFLILVCKSKVFSTNKALQKHKGNGVFKHFYRHLLFSYIQNRKLLIIVSSYSKWYWYVAAYIATTVITAIHCKLCLEWLLLQE